MSKSTDDWFCSTCLASIFPFNHFDNDIDFLFALFDFNSQGDFDTHLLKQKNFNPFFDDPVTSHLLLNSNLDPDINCFSANSELLSNCLYLTSTEFYKMPSPPSDTFSSLHINIRSLQKHFDDLSEFLLTLNRSFSVIAFSETWLHTVRSNSDLFHFSGYHFITLQQLQHSGLEWKPSSGLKSIILTLLMIPMIHSLAFLCQHTISHFHLNLPTLSATVLQNPGLQRVSLYHVTGRIFSINNSKRTLLY